MILYMMNNRENAVLQLIVGNHYSYQHPRRTETSGLTASRKGSNK